MLPRILLLGSNGQLGWELQRALAPLGEIFACDRQRCDLSISDAVASVLKDVAPDVIVNAAAFTAVDRAENERAMAVRINTEAVAQLAAYARRANKPLIHYSTDYVFDGRKTASYREADDTNPLSVYGESKRDGELAIIQSCCPHLIFRTSWVFAARGANFAKTMLRLSKDKEALRVVGDQFGAPTSAELIADVTAHALRGTLAGQAPGGLYHLAASGETSWHGYASYVVERARALGAPVKVKSIEAIGTAEYPLPATRPANSRLNTEKLQRVFNLTLPHWQYHVERMLVELLGNPDGLP